MRHDYAGWDMGVALLEERVLRLVLVGYSVVYTLYITHSY
jgi:hypothetical protein